MQIKEIAADEAVLELLRQSGLPTADLGDGYVRFFAAGVGNAPDGVVGIGCFGPVALLRSLAVKPVRRRAGIGSRLVAHAENEARKHGASEIYLLTEGAEPFFARRGYTKLPREHAPEAIRRTREYAELCPNSAVLMRKTLATEDATGFLQEALPTPDGAMITARVFTPEGAARAGVVIVPAMGVAQPYYAAFASWLARRGMLALTFDFRGMGLSRAGPLRRLRADIIDWARYDCAAALDALAARVPGRPVYWIGHSLGGQIIPFVPNRERVAKFITIGTGSGYWRENAEPVRRRVWVLWFVLVPLLVPLFGYFPGKRLGIVGDLPAGVMRQWRRWCLHPEYAAGVEGEAARALYASVRTPIVSLSFTDDEFMSARNTESMHGFYVNAPRTMKRFAPQDIGVARIGHFGFFRTEFAESLWERELLPELG